MVGRSQKSESNAEFTQGRNELQIKEMGEFTSFVLETGKHGTEMLPQPHAVIVCLTISQPELIQYASQTPPEQFRGST